MRLATAIASLGRISFQSFSSSRFPEAERYLVHSAQSEGLSLSCVYHWA
jgi:hypothetical protein